jgi:hypothetical protein
LRHLAPYTKGVKTPQDEIKGSNLSPSAYFEGMANTIKADESKNSPTNWGLKAQTSTTEGHDYCT